jgi:predicted transcriptional regulator of viral defense system
VGSIDSAAILSDLAEAQLGLFTAKQAEIHGVPRRDLSRLATAGVLNRITHGVYRFSGAPRPRLLELWAAWLQLATETDASARRPDQGVVSHGSAALVYDAGFLMPFHHEFTFPPTRRVRSRRKDIRIHHADLPGGDVQWHEEILVTSPSRTVSDLAESALDGDHLGAVIQGLLDRNLATRGEILSALGPHAPSYGVRNAHALLRTLTS